jgi:hypothetical protein
MSLTLLPKSQPKTTTLSKFVQLSTAFSAEVKLDQDFTYNLELSNEKIEGYIPSHASRIILAKILDKLDESTTDKVHLIQASYGKGKSYLLLMLANLVANNRPGVLDSFIQKVVDKDEQLTDGLGKEIERLAKRDDRFLIVIPNYADTDFRHALLQGLINALDAQGIAYRPDTVYLKAAGVLEKWRTDNPSLFNKFASHVVTKDVDTFIAQLRVLDHPTYEQFREYFEAVVGSSFSESDAADAYDVYAETARKIRPEYRGIIILYDEFGDMLDKMINKPEGSGLAVQEFLERIKRPTSTGARPNIIFVAATHQDPSALAQRQQADINKIVGRFQKHLLGITRSTFHEAADAAETQEAAELLGTVFLHPEAGRSALATLLTPEYLTKAAAQAMKHQLFGSLPNAWVQAQVVHGLFPLHPLTARLLPKISNELAQSNRTMFNFLSPRQTDVGGMQHFLLTQSPCRANVDEDERPVLFTPDRLLDFFETNLAVREHSGESQASIWLNDYRNAAGKVTGEARAERLLRNLLMLKIVRDNRLAPTADLLFYAQDEPQSQRREFDNLLATLVAREFLDYDRITDTYDFPTNGGLTAMQAENEENRKLSLLTLEQCASLWQEVQRRQELTVKQFGTDRVLIPHLVHTPADVRPLLVGLTSYYQGQADPVSPRGLLLYLLADTPSEANALTDAITAAPLAAPYVLQAYPRHPDALEELRSKTRPYRVLQKALDRPEIPNPSPLRDRLNTRLRATTDALRTAIKEFFEPTQWEWRYGSEVGPEFNSRRKFEEWLERHVLAQFEQMPDVRDDALWFVSRSKNRKERQDAFATLYTSPPNLLPLRKPGNALADRILENTLHSLSLHSTKTNKNQVQYCELREPEKDTPEAAIFAHFDKALKGSTLVSAADLFLPLLAAPFGLSEHLIKFFFGLYNRLHVMQLTIYKGKVALPKSLETLDALLQNPAQYGQYSVRRIILSGPMTRYLRRLRELFNDQSASSFADVAKQLKGVQQFLTPVERALIARRGGQVADFYERLADLSLTIGEIESQEFFLDDLPNTLLGLTSREALLEDADQIDKLIKRLSELKELPAAEENVFQQETLRELGRGVFGVEAASKDALQAAARAWYDNLASPKRLHHYENPYLNQWLHLLRDGAQGQDLALWYLRDLTDSPLRDWQDDLAGRQMGLIKEFIQHKATVEAFTRPALPVLQRIARGAFHATPAECASEAAFAELFRNWYAGLPLLSQQHIFADSAAAYLLDNMNSSAGTVHTFLETIPRRWHDKGSLRTALASTWEDWSETTVKAIADEYERCIGLINAWQPPIAEADFFRQVGMAFDLPETDTPAKLLAALQADWLLTLPERTRLAPWAGQNSDEALLMKHLLDSDDVYRLFSQTFPERWQLNPLAAMDSDTVSSYVQKLMNLRVQIEAYRRPLLEIVHKLKRIKSEQYTTPVEYQNALLESIRDTSAFRHEAEKDVTLQANEPARILLSQLRTRAKLDRLLSAFATTLGLPTEQHLWTNAEQEQFVIAWKKAQDTLFNWKFPEDRNLTNAKQKLSNQVQALQAEFGLTPAQLRKILGDVMPQT